jgi:protocatechuate 3,4-dioxygenase beta subunit
MKILPNISILAIISLAALGSYLFFTRKDPTPGKMTIMNKPSPQTSPEPPNPPRTCKDPTPSQTEGPYYKSGTPKRTNFLESGTSGEPITITGYVLDGSCRPVSNAWLDFWQADGSGEYDNIGYKLRGHQYTDSEGKYILQTIIPEPYSGRTAHIHVKVRPTENSPILTTQLYFPQNPTANAKDTIYTPDTLLEITEKNGQKTGYYNFYLIQ